MDNLPGIPTADASNPAPANAAAPRAAVVLLRQTRPWVLFLSILGFVGTGFMLLGGLLVSVMSALAPKEAGIPVWMGLIYVGLAAFYLLPSLFLFRYAASIRRLCDLGSEDALLEALGRQKSFWKLVGISTIVILCLYFLFVIGMMVFAVLMAKHMPPPT